MITKFKIAIVVSHPIQHFCPQYVSFAKSDFSEIKVFFGSAMGFKKYVDSSFGKEIFWDNLNLESFPHVFLNGDHVLPANKNLDAKNLDAELSEYSPEVVITYGYFQKLQRRAQNWAKQNKVPVAFIADSERRRERPYWVEALKYFYVRYRLRSMDYFLSVGDANEAYYKFYGVPDRKFIRMPFPIDTIIFDKIYKQKKNYRIQKRSLFQISDDSIVLGVVGKIELFKHQQDIIKAIVQLNEKQKKVVLLIIGTGPYEQNLRELATTLNEKCVIFVGFIPPDELPAYYAAMDIYIHPSAKDAHSLAISEAIYMGCPVLLSDRCGSYGPTDDVQEGKNGFVFRTGDIDEITKLIKHLIDDNDLRTSFGDCSRTLALKNQIDAHSAGIKALVERIKLKTKLRNN